MIILLSLWLLKYFSDGKFCLLDGDRIATLVCFFLYMSRLMTKPTKWLWAQWRLWSAYSSAQFDQSSLGAQWVAKDPSFLHADSKASEQTGRMPRLIFAGCTCHFWLNRMLIGELIAKVGLRRLSIVHPSVHHPHSLNIFSETTGPIVAKFHIESPWDGGTKVCSNGPCHMW